MRLSPFWKLVAINIQDLWISLKINTLELHIKKKKERKKERKKTNAVYYTGVALSMSILSSFGRPKKILFIFLFFFKERKALRIYMCRSDRHRADGRSLNENPEKRKRNSHAWYAWCFFPPVPKSNSVWVSGRREVQVQYIAEPLHFLFFFLSLSPLFLFSFFVCVCARFLIYSQAPKPVRFPLLARSPSLYIEVREKIRICWSLLCVCVWVVPCLGTYTYSMRV